MRRLVVSLLLITLGCAAPLPLTLVRHQTLPDVGAAQGVATHNGLIYVYGDADTGILREYRLIHTPALGLVPTGRSVRLTRNGTDLISHPTGLTFHPDFGCYLGDTVRGQGILYRIDFDRALADGHLDNAILHTVVDDAAVNGTRPEFVRLGDTWLLATSDYGPGPNFVRFYDPARLATAARTSEPGVEVRRVPCGPFVQNLHFVRHTGQLVLVQNQTAGLRWRFTVIRDLAALDYRTATPIDLARPTDELEGALVFTPSLAIYVSAMSRDNVTFAIGSR
jgi:hypothetical protein